MDAEAAAMSFRAIGFLIGLAATITASTTLVSAQQAIFVVRHSDPPPTLSLDEIRDETPLSESGQQRAKMLAGRLRDAGITAIYATQARRTVETAEPLAKRLGIEIRVQSYHDTDGLVRRLRSEHGSDRVLVVGHWSTIPLILKALGDQQAIKIEPTEYDNLFVVIPHGEQIPAVLHLHY
jgi:broad specificity phosphatase PhoE